VLDALHFSSPEPAGLAKLSDEEWKKALTFSDRAQQDRRIEFCAMLGGVTHAIRLAGTGARDGLSLRVKERRPDGRGSEVNGQDGRMERAASHA